MVIAYLLYYTMKTSAHWDESMSGIAAIGRTTRYLILVLVAVIGFSGPAHAYIDPGAGSLILQALAALGVGLLFYIRRITDAIKRLFGKAPPRGRNDTEEQPDP